MDDFITTVGIKPDAAVQTSKITTWNHEGKNLLFILFSFHDILSSLKFILHAMMSRH